MRNVAAALLVLLAAGGCSRSIEGDGRADVSPTSSTPATTTSAAPTDTPVDRAAAEAAVAAFVTAVNGDDSPGAYGLLCAADQEAESPEDFATDFPGSVQATLGEQVDDAVYEVELVFDEDAGTVYVQLELGRWCLTNDSP